MQAKDIPEQPVLDFLARLQRKEILHDYGNCSFYPTSGTWFEGFPHSVLNAMPVGTPPKVALAKMRSMIKRGLVTGCVCGCRGDFALVGDK